MTELNINQNIIERFISDISTDSVLMDTFLNYESDGVIGKQRGKTIDLIWASSQSPTPSDLDDLFEQAYTYATEFQRMSISPELRTKIMNEALSVIPASLVLQTDEGSSYVPQNPISLLLGQEDENVYDISTLGAYVCKLGISAGILSEEGILSNVRGANLEDIVTVTSEIPILRSQIILEILSNPSSIIQSLLPDINSAEEFDSCRATLEIVIPEYFKGRVKTIIEKKRSNRVSLSQNGGNQVYSRWSYIWEDAQEEKVRELFPEIDPNDKAVFYGKARELAEVKLARDIISRDLETGDIPGELTELVDSYLIEITEGRMSEISIDGFLQFINQQKDVAVELSQAGLDQVGDLGELADYRGIGLKAVYSPTKRGDFISRVQQTDIVTLGEQRPIELGVRTIEYLPNYEVKYPESVIKAFEILVQRWNTAFIPLIKANREWNTDYQFCFPDNNGVPTNFMVQIDMQGLDNQYLKWADTQDPRIIATDLITRVYEFENSLADYAYLQAVGVEIASSVDALRERFSMPVMLLATTEQKYREMRVAEFGEAPDGNAVEPGKVRELSGFDGLLGPREFTNYLKDNNGNCEFLLYVRSSPPKSQLRDPRQRAEQTFLSNNDLRRIVKAYSVMMNIDNPSDPIGKFSRINDTKLYMPQLGMGYPIISIGDVAGVRFREFMTQKGISESGILRAKPALESYGGYGQFRGQVNDSRFIRLLNSEMRARGQYIIQPDLPNAELIAENGEQYAYIDRNYLGWNGRSYSFLGGERTLMPIRSSEVESGRIHANQDAILASISIMKS